MLAVEEFFESGASTPVLMSFLHPESVSISFHRVDVNDFGFSAVGFLIIGGKLTFCCSDLILRLFRSHLSSRRIRVFL